MKLEHTEVIPKSLKTQTGNLAQIREAQRIDAIFVSRSDAAPVWYLTSKMRSFLYIHFRHFCRKSRLPILTYTYCIFDLLNNKAKQEG